MRRLVVMLLGLAWLSGLLVLDGWLLLHPDNLELQGRQLLALVFHPGAEYERIEGDFREGVEITGLSLPNGPKGPPLVRVQSLGLELEWERLLDGRLPLVAVKAQEVAVTLPVGDDGLAVRSPLLARPSPAPDAAPPELPRFELQGLTVTITGRPELVSAPLRPERFEIALVPVEGSVGRRHALRGVIRDEALGELRLEGERDGRSLSCALQPPEGAPLRIEKLRALVPKPWQAPVDGWILEGDIRPELHLRAGPGMAPEFEVRGQLLSGLIGYEGWPLAIEELRGPIFFRGGILGGDALVGQVRGTPLAIPRARLITGDRYPRFVVDAELRGLQIDDDLVARIGGIPRPGDQIAEQLRAFELRGPADLDVILERPEPGIRWVKPTVQVRLSGADFVHRGPLRDGRREGGVRIPLERVQARIRLDEKSLDIVELKARRGESVVTADGLIRYPRDEEHEWDVKIRAGSLAVGKELWPHLPRGVRALAETLRLEGPLNARINPRRRAGGRDELAIELGLDGMSVEPRFFPYALRGIEGRVSVLDDVVRVKEVLRARSGGGAVAIDGEMLGTGIDASLALSVRVDRLPMDAALIDALRASLDPSPVLEALQPGGTLNAELSVVRAPRGEAFVTGKVWGRDLRLAVPLRSGRTEVAVPSLSMQLDREGINLVSGSRMIVAGVEVAIEGRARAPGDFAFSFRAADQEIRRELLELVETSFPALRGELIARQLSGRFDAAGSFRGHQVDASDTALEAEVALRGVSLNPCATSDCPFGVRDLGATVNLQDGVFTLGELGAQVLAGGAVAPLSIVRGEHSEAGGLLLSGLEFGPLGLGPWMRDLPWAEELERLGLLRISGRLQGALESLELPLGAQGRTGATLTSGRLRVEDLHLADQGLDAEVLVLDRIEAVIAAGREVADARLEVTGLRTEDEDVLTAARVRIPALSYRPKSGLRGRLQATSVRVLGVPASELEAELEAKGPTLRLGRLRGEIFARTPQEARNSETPPGLLQAAESWFVVNRGTKTFRTKLVIERAWLSSIVRALGGSIRKMRGLGKISLEVAGHLNDPGSLTGRGRIEGKVVGLVDLPLMLSLVVLLDVPALLFQEEPALVELDLRIRDRIVMMERVHVNAGGVDLDGWAWVRFDGALGGWLDTSFKGGVPLVSQVLSFPLKLAADAVELRGSLGEPRPRLRSAVDPRPEWPAGMRPRSRPLRPRGGNRPR